MSPTRRQILVALIGATFRTDRRLAVIAPILTVLAQLSAPLIALGVKLAVDAALTRDREQAIVAALLSAGAAALLYLLSLVASRVTATLSDRLGLLLDGEIATAATEFPGLEHFETPSILDQFTLLRSGYLLGAARLLIGVIGTSARTTAAIVLLASISPFLLAVPLLILPAIGLMRVADTHPRSGRAGGRPTHPAGREPGPHRDRPRCGQGSPRLPDRSHADRAVRAGADRDRSAA